MRLITGAGRDDDYRAISSTLYEQGCVFSTKACHTKRSGCTHCHTVPYHLPYSKARRLEVADSVYDLEKTSLAVM